MKKLLFFFSLVMAVFCFSQDESLIPNSDFKDLDAAGVAKGWSLRTKEATYTFEDGVATMANAEGKPVVLVRQMLKELKPATQYIFSCKLKAAENTSAQAYVESTTVEAGKMKWHGVETKKFSVGTEWKERRFSFIVPEGATATYMAFISATGVPLSIKELVVRAARVRPALGGGYWDLENQVELIDNGAVATKDKPAKLIGITVEPGKVYMLSYIAEGVGETGNDYPFHEMTVRVTPREVQGNYFFNDVRNVPMPKIQKIGIPAKTAFTKINVTFNDADTQMGASMDCYLNGFNDPRKFLIAKPASGDGKLHGVRGGINPNKWDDYKNAAGKVSAPNASKYKLCWLNAAEVAFLRAEGAVRGWEMGGTAKAFYEQGITLSFEEWGADGAATYIANTTAQPVAFTDNVGSANAAKPSSVTIAWSDSGTEEQKLEKIGTQKWIALFPNGCEGWAEYRRLHYPVLIKPANNFSNGIVNDDQQIRRVPYPLSEQSDNPTGYASGVAALGGADNAGTRLWWDQKPF